MTRDSGIFHPGSQQKNSALHQDTTLEGAEKLGFVVGRGFIPGISVVILVAFGPEVRFFARGNGQSIPQGLKAESFRGIMYGLKPVPTSPYLPARTYR